MSPLANIVILGDYECALRRFSHWESLDQRAKITIHHEPLQGEALYEAVKDADVVIENFKVGGLAKYGLNWESLRRLDHQPN